MVRLVAAVGFVLSLSLLGGCGGSTLSRTRAGTLVVTFQFPRQQPTPQRLIPSAATEIVVTLSGEGLRAPLKGSATKSNPSVLFSEVPAGAKLVLAFSRTASTAPSPATMGAATATVVPGESTTVTVELQPVKPPSSLLVDRLSDSQIALTDADKGETLFLGNNGGLQWFGFATPQATVTFDTPVSLPNGATVGQSASQGVVGVGGTATMRLVGVMGVGVPGGDFADCVVVELVYGNGVSFRRTLYLARQFGPVMWFEGAPLGFTGQPTGGEQPLPSVLVSGQVGATPFSFANPFNGLGAPAYDGQLSAYLVTQGGTRYDFSDLLRLANPPSPPL